MTSAWRLANARSLTLDRPRILAIINCTPDSFSDGGALDAPGAALAHCMACLESGADALDIGGESTRPGASPVAPDEQQRRVVTLIKDLRSRNVHAPVSIDTTSAQVARAALDAGADAINDVSAGQDDPGMLALAAERACGLILMHRLHPPAHDRYSHSHETPPMYDPQSGGVVGVVKQFLAQRAAAAMSAGVLHDALVLDPGLGFGKSVEQNYTLIRQAPALSQLGFPLLSAASRKSFIGAAGGVTIPAQRVHGSVAVSVAHFLLGVRIFRVHDVGAHAEALRIAQAVIDGAGPEHQHAH